MAQELVDKSIASFQTIISAKKRLLEMCVFAVRYQGIVVLERIAERLWTARYRLARSFTETTKAAGHFRRLTISEVQKAARELSAYRSFAETLTAMTFPDDENCPRVGDTGPTMTASGSRSSSRMTC